MSCRKEKVQSDEKNQHLAQVQFLRQEVRHASEFRPFARYLHDRRIYVLYISLLLYCRYQLEFDMFGYSPDKYIAMGKPGPNDVIQTTLKPKV